MAKLGRPKSADPMVSLNIRLRRSELDQLKQRYPETFRENAREAVMDLLSSARGANE